jgi:adenine-specific DNA-methyltransferase
MARKKSDTKSPTPVESITHADKRANLPTAGAEDFVSPELERPVSLRYPRDPTLDPQLVWKRKDELDGEDLVAEAPPIYIQEKIDPRVLIENLRDTAARPKDEPELSLFDTFDGLPELDLVEFYQHDANWSNRMILGDSLNVMASLAEREALRGKVQMVYIDPPYGIRFGSNWQVSARKRDVKDGKIEDASREVEQIKAFRDTWELGIHSYLSYLRDRLTVAKDLLTASGSLFVQIGDENVHLVRSLMDEVFGSENFVASLNFRTMNPLESGQIESVYDHIIWYARAKDALKYRNLWTPKNAGAGSEFVFIDDENGGVTRCREPQEHLDRIYKRSDLISSGYTPSCTFPIEFAGKTRLPRSGKSWRTNPEGIARLVAANRLFELGEKLYFKLYLSDFGYQSRENTWTDTAAGYSEAKWYVVQTANRVVERCLLMTTDPGDLVVDPTCGAGTTAWVAEQWGRRWITVDTSRVALALARQRLMGARFPYYLLADSPEGRAKESDLAADELPPTETANDIRHGFIYQRVQHITLKSIANNPDIREGMSREEIDAAIRRHAEYELLYDKPYEDKRKVRVAGPFTVESLSPHRSLAFAGSAVDATAAVNAEANGSASSGDVEFEQMILANIRTAGIQNGRRNERLEFDSVEPYASPYIQAVGEREGTDDDGAPKRIGIAVGPQYGTVGPSFIKDAAREANHAEDLDLLCVLAFAFDPAVLGSDNDYVTS